VQQHMEHNAPGADDVFPTDVEGLAEASAPAPLELADGDVLDLRLAPVVKRAVSAPHRSRHRS
jgi:hypothetical protein